MYLKTEAVSLAFPCFGSGVAACIGQVFHFHFQGVLCEHERERWSLIRRWSEAGGLHNPISSNLLGLKPVYSHCYTYCMTSSNPVYL
jgi:hypothetical protein